MIIPRSTNALSLLFFALVDLKMFAELPDVFIVPSDIITTHFEKELKALPEDYWLRHHETVEKLDSYKNNWDVISNLLIEPNLKVA